MNKTLKKYFPLFLLPTIVCFLIAFLNSVFNRFISFVYGVYNGNKCTVDWLWKLYKIVYGR